MNNKGMGVLEILVIIAITTALAAFVVYVL